MSQEVQHDGTNVAVKGQRSRIFQSECKIKDKVCKLIIDGPEFFSPNAKLKTRYASLLLMAVVLLMPLV
jgi:hypothetical protein